MSGTAEPAPGRGHGEQEAGPSAGDPAARDGGLVGRFREQVGFGAAAPLDEYRGGVVLELPWLAVDDGVPEAAQRLGGGLARGGLSLDELAKTGDRDICPSR